MSGPVSYRGPISRLLYGSEAIGLSLRDGGLVLKDASSERLIPVAEISDLMVCEAGPVWATARVQTRNGERRLRGFPKASLPAVVDGLNRALQADVDRRYAHLDAPLAERLRDIEAITSASDYVRASQWNQFLGATRELLTVREDGLWRKHATPSQRAAVARITLFLQEAEGVVARSNAAFVAAQLEEHGSFFDKVEANPLTDAQRRACVINEDHNLVLAGAGTGKTSTMIGRAGYLIASGRAKPDEILMLAFARKASEEMQERQDARLDHWLKDGTPTIKTFHALGLEIIGKAEGKRPDISPLAEDAHLFAQFIDETIASQCEEPEYQRMLVRYLGTERFPYRNPFDFESMEEYLEYARVSELRTLKGEVVKSFEEVFIANFLNANGVDYQYEHPYVVDTSDPDHRRYKPDFYLPEYDVYLEHFALDRSGQPPSHFKGYLEGVRWKREIHATHGTRLLQTYSYMKREDLLESSLVEQLVEAGVKLTPRSDAEMLDEMRSSSQVAEFAIFMGEFITLLKQAGEDIPSIRRRLAANIDGSRIMAMLDLAEPVLGTYEARLAEEGSIDFADMISRATEHVVMGRYVSPYRQVLVDEFQDISRPRAALVRALLGQVPDAVLFTVGDDWQSIYRFTGSDIGYTRDFQTHFGATAVTSLDKTFRFNSMIGEVASRFVLQNPEQIPKTVTSDRPSSEPTVSLVRTLSMSDGLNVVLEAIAKRESGNGDKASVLVLGRFNHTVDEWRTQAETRRLKTVYPGLEIRFMTVHGAKGKEADYVVVLGVDEGRYGFPSERPADPLLEVLLPPCEAFAFAEERRLFYVALTRARHRVYLVHDAMTPSVFVRELRDVSANYHIAVNEFDDVLQVADIPTVPCPTCGTGMLVVREGPYSRFAGCTHYPYCEHHESLCPKCGNLMRRTDRKRECVNPVCGETVTVCAKCGADMVERTSKYGRFLGCSNYGRGNGLACTYVEKIKDAPRGVRA